MINDKCKVSIGARYTMRSPRYSLIDAKLLLCIDVVVVAIGILGINLDVLSLQKAHLVRLGRYYDIIMLIR